jgi:hypothetical protein
LADPDGEHHQRRALLIGGAATILYLVTAPAVPNLDGLGYLKLIPHDFAAGHLLYMPALRFFARVFGDGLRGGRLYDAVLGGTGVVLFYSIARRMLPAAIGEDATRRFASVAAAGMALSYGYWCEANDVEVYAAAMVALLMTVRMALSYRAHPTFGRAIFTGALLGVAVLSHLTHVLLAPFVGLYLHWHGPRRIGIWHAFTALATGALLSLAVYAYAAFGVRGHDLAGAIAWVKTASHGFVSPDGPYRLADAVYGFSKALVASPYLEEADAQKLIGQFLLGFIPLMLVAAGIVVRPQTLKGLDARALAAWTIPYALVAIFFFGSDSERWIFVLPVVWLVAAVELAAVERPLRAAAMALVWIGGFNLVTSVWPAHRDQWPRQKAEATAKLLGDGDLVIFPGHSWDEYIVFYSHAQIEPFPVAYYVPRDGVQAGLQRLDRELDAALARHGRIFAARIFDDADEDRRGFWELSTRGLPRAALREKLLARFSPSTITPLGGFSVTRLDPRDAPISQKQSTSAIIDR